MQLQKTKDGLEEYAEFAHLPRRQFTDFALVHKEIEDETDRLTGETKQISAIPIHLSIYSPNVVINLTLIDLPGLTRVAVEGQPESIVQEIENMVRTYVQKLYAALVMEYETMRRVHKTSAKSAAISKPSGRLLHLSIYF
ncbi:unnamed protein product [Cuscuta campestris]|uniref:Dynamin GTPase domain-containing protein n=1 Tax=Cuscuta campestris TaxID=132261 RepID=A0A484M859_9ASTE|nr:unnamed protein product [Cuscuta campestris]